MSYFRIGYNPLAILAFNISAIRIGSLCAPTDAAVRQNVPTLG